MGFHKYIKNRIDNLHDKIPNCKDGKVRKLLEQKKYQYRKLIGLSI